MTEPRYIPDNEDQIIEERRNGHIQTSLSKTVTFGTVVDPHPEFVVETLLLLRSIRALGGRHANAQVNVYVVGGASRKFAAELERMGANVLASEPFDVRCKPSNKLAMMEPIDTNYLLMLDNDCVVAGDISHHLVGESIGLKAECSDHVGMEGWHHLFDYLNIPMSPHRYLMSMYNTESIGYFNSGVILVPKQHVCSLYDAWGPEHQTVFDALNSMPDSTQAGTRAHVGQTALTLALAQSDIPHRVLPIEMHYHTRFAFHPAWNADLCEPLVLHHHHAMLPGCVGVKPSHHTRPNQVIERVNEAIASFGPLPDIESLVA